MRKRIMILLLICILVMSFSSTAFAAGKPAAHLMTGREFGERTSALAQSEPGAVPAHSGAGSKGMPAIHAMSGYEFGQRTSGLAKSEPGAIPAHKGI